MPLERRATGWLDDLMHARLREILLHACTRYSLACPVYCLMPDHAHFLIMGIGANSDQQPAVRMLRRQWTSLLPPGMELQRQSYDHLLREDERARGAFENTAHYILENPVRAGLVVEFSAWPYAGSLVPGYPSLNPRNTDFWTSFWLAHEAVSS
jgi:REP element-mobilizing transposase RayT